MLHAHRDHVNLLLIFMKNERNDERMNLVRQGKEERGGGSSN